MTPRASPPPPRPLVHLGWSSQQHFECTFAAHVEFSVDSDLGYTTVSASTRFECCNQCGLTTGCQDFVYQHSSGECLLLPHASSSKEITRLPNPNVVSGSLVITTVRQETMKHGQCLFKPASGFTRGSLGVASAIASGTNKPILTRQDCCDACMNDPKMREARLPAGVEGARSSCHWPRSIRVMDSSLASSMAALRAFKAAQVEQVAAGPAWRRGRS